MHIDLSTSFIYYSYGATYESTGYCQILPQANDYFPNVESFIRNFLTGRQARRAASR